MSVCLWYKFDVELEASEIVMTHANVKIEVQQVCIPGTKVQIQVMYICYKEIIQYDLYMYVES